MTDSEARPSSRRLSSSSASSATSSSDEARPAIQWLATAREKRSTAGNRMKSMLANEEPDSDLELLFAEDDDDQGFSDAGDDASDVHMDSSSDDEDEGKGSDFEGEKELEQQAKEKKAAQRKRRKAQDAIPARFRKKVRIDPTTTTTASSASTTPRPAAAAPAPRPKKKSERASWLPSAADQPTRASLRHTTRLSKEQLHAQMEEREARRLKQMAQMQKKAEKLEAMKKPPLTQEERLREAEIVERRNSKSLNRWEEAEKQREEERMAKLAALNQRTLKGPVITFWSGTREWTDGGAARYVVLEEKPKRKPREKKDKGKDKDKSKAGDAATPQPQDTVTAAVAGPTTGQEAKAEPAPAPAPATTEQDGGESKVTTEASQEQSAPKHSGMAMPPSQDAPRSSSLAAPTPPPPSGLAAPAPEPTPPQSQNPESRPPNPKPSGILAAPVLAPPAGIDPSPNDDTASRHSPASVLAAPSPQPPQPPSTLPEQPQPQIAAAPIKDIENLRDSVPAASNTPSEAAPSTEDRTYTRNAIVYQNFDDNLIKDKNIQTQILFGRRMNKLSKPPPLPICVITNHPAKYRDPKTGLPFYNSYAYRQIQRLCKGDYHWSKLLGAWVGAGSFAAKGVPERFLNPNAPPPPRPPPKAEAEKAPASGSGEKKEPGVAAPAPAAVVKKEGVNPAVSSSAPPTNAPATIPKDVASTPALDTAANPTPASTNDAKPTTAEAAQQKQGPLAT